MFQIFARRTVLPSDQAISTPNPSQYDHNFWVPRARLGQSYHLILTVAALSSPV